MDPLNANLILRHFIHSTHRPSAPPIVIGESSVGFDHVALMGIVNVTPDSFSDGGRFLDHDRAIAHAHTLIEDGADFIDIGGESTRPGAEPVEPRSELERVVPVVAALSATDAWISIDTTKSVVAAAALDAGAHVINDISGFGFDPEMPALAADRGCPVVLMHIQGDPKTMQTGITYDDVVDDIRAYFEHRIELAVRAGCTESQIIIDPGIGFGKTVAHNYEILRRLGEFVQLGRPILLGTSRKSFIGAIVDKPAPERDWGTAATMAWGVAAGADILRVHDVAAMRDVAHVTAEILGDAPKG